MALDLKATVSLDGSSFESGIKRIEGAVTHVGETLKSFALGAIGIYGIEQALHKTIDTADRLVDTANRLGISLTALQEFGFAARQNGADIESLTRFIEKLNQTRVDPKYAEFYQKLGVSNPMAGGVDDIVMQLNAYLRNHNPQEFAGSLRQVGGKGAGEMINFLTDNLDELRAAANALGIVISTKDLVTVKFLKDELQILADAIMADFVPVIASATKGILYAGNAIRSAFTLVMDAAKSINPKDIVSAMNPFSNKSVFDVITDSLADASLGAATQLALSNMKTDQLMADLEAKQKRREQFTGLPDANGDPTEARRKSAKIYSDELTKVGNFLGGTSNPLISINQQQLVVLRQIAENTKDRAGSEDIFPPVG